MRNFSELGYRLLSRIKVAIKWLLELGGQSFYLFNISKDHLKKVKGIFNQILFINQHFYN